MRRTLLAPVILALLITPLVAEQTPRLDDATIQQMLAEKATRAQAARARLESGSGGGSAVAVQGVLPMVIEMSVDCDAGESVSTVLRRAAARFVVLNLSGTCRESVRVERPGVTLTGTAAGGAVIDPAGAGPAIRALWAHELRLADLTLTHGTEGLSALASRGMQMERVEAVDNLYLGVYLESSDLTIFDSELSRSSTPIHVNKHSSAWIYDTTMEDNANDGPYASWNSQLVIVGSRMFRNGYGPNGHDFSNIEVYDSIVGPATPVDWSGAWWTMTLTFYESEVQTGIWAQNKSVLQIDGSEVGTAAVTPVIGATHDSYIKIRDTSSAAVIASSVELYNNSKLNARMAGTIAGSIWVGDFSDMLVISGVQMPGSVGCGLRARAFCSPDPAGGVDPACE